MSIRSSACEKDPHERVIVGFTSAAGEYDFAFRAAEQPGKLHSGFVHCFSRRAASPMTLEGFPYGSSRTTFIASMTSPAMGVLALKSM